MINQTHFGVDIYERPEEKLVALLYFLIKDHPFTDGNKRTACLVFEIACELNDLEPHYNGFTLDELAVYVERVKPKDHQDFIRGTTIVLFDL
ncbi:Fic family protein [Candidatus Kaiserbacteria bacterium]|nr:Fic family protein [Candidatus Kaiserbacteria bacterium]